MKPRENTPSPRSGAREPSAPLDPKLLAASRREALRRRASRIRRSVTGLALALFTAAFVGIYVQLASGHDPALTAAAKRNATTPASTSTSADKTSTGAEAATGASTTSEASSSETSSESEASSSGTSSSSEESSQSPSSVTTSQS